MNRLDRLKSIDQPILQEFLLTRNRDSIGIEEEFADYVLQINAVPAIVHHVGSGLTRVISGLRKQFPKLSYAQARSIYSDAMNLFYIDDSVTSDAWDSYYAEQFDNLARLSIAMNKPEAAMRAFSKAHELKTRATDRIKIEEWKAPVFVVSDKINYKDLGFEKESVYEISRKHEDGFYRNMIDSLPISDSEKNRLKQDAKIEDVDCEELESD